MLRNFMEPSSCAQCHRHALVTASGYRRHSATLGALGHPSQLFLIVLTQHERFRLGALAPGVLVRKNNKANPVIEFMVEIDESCRRLGTVA
jgi:hypothetical protein